MQCLCDELLQHARMLCGKLIINNRTNMEATCCSSLQQSEYQSLLHMVGFIHVHVGVTELQCYRVTELQCYRVTVL